MNIDRLKSTVKNNLDNGISDYLELYDHEYTKIGYSEMHVLSWDFERFLKNNPHPEFTRFVDFYQLNPSGKLSLLTPKNSCMYYFFCRGIHAKYDYWNQVMYLYKPMQNEN